MLLPLLALLFDHRQIIFFAPCFVSCVIVFILAYLRHAKIAWPYIIYGALIIGAIVAIPTNLFLHLNKFWLNEFNLSVKMLEKSFDFSIAQIAQNKKYAPWMTFFNQFKVFFVLHATTFVMISKLVWSIVYTAFAEQLLASHTHKKISSKKANKKTFAIIGLVFLFVSIAVSFINKNISVDILFFCIAALACNGFADLFSLLVRRKKRNILPALYIITLLIPSVICLPLAIYSLINMIRVLSSTTNNTIDESIIDNTTKGEA